MRKLGIDETRNRRVVYASGLVYVHVYVKIKVEWVVDTMRSLGVNVVVNQGPEFTTDSLEPELA